MVSKHIKPARHTQNLSCYRLPLLHIILDWQVLILKGNKFLFLYAINNLNGFSSNRIPEAFTPFLKAYRSLHSVKSVLRGLMEPPLQGSSHQPARERRAVAILRARSVPHRTMGAAILERTK